MSFLYSLAPGALATVAWVGGLTALFAGTIGLCQRDIKKVLAYSTVSQLGYMFLAAGVGAYSAAIFHLVTHAFFKALLFLAAGSVILGMHHEQDTAKMGGLSRLMPWTYWTFLAGVLAISGVPGLSGFFSKDEILLGAWLAHDIPGHLFLWAIGVGTAGITAFYMFRLHFLVFSGESRATPEVRDSIHESNNWVVMPLVGLAVLSVVGGVIGFPDAYGDLLFSVHNSNSLHYFLQPVAASAPHEVSHATEYGLAGFVTLVALGGIGLAAFLYYYRTELVAPLTERIRPLYELVFNKYWVDELYDAAIVRPLMWFSDHVLYRIIDARLIDGLGVNGTARAVYDSADRGLKLVQNGMTQSYVLVMVVGGICVIVYLVGGF
jgi:NADH-quinone oxidoreductase subunit L